jgi:hypothetical protein
MKPAGKSPVGAVRQDIPILPPVAILYLLRYIYLPIIN